MKRMKRILTLVGLMVISMAVISSQSFAQQKIPPVQINHKLKQQQKMPKMPKLKPAYLASFRSNIVKYKWIWNADIQNPGKESLQLEVACISRKNVEKVIASEQIQNNDKKVSIERSFGNERLSTALRARLYLIKKTGRKTTKTQIDSKFIALPKPTVKTGLFNFVPSTYEYWFDMTNTFPAGAHYVVKIFDITINGFVHSESVILASNEFWRTGGKYFFRTTHPPEYKFRVDVYVVDPEGLYKIDTYISRVFNGE